MDNNVYATTTCESGGDITLPTAPTKYGYTFQGWSTYTPIEYLESTGAQWIDTGILATTQTGIEIKFSSSFVNANNALFGSREAYHNKAFSTWIYGAGGFRVDIGDNEFLTQSLQKNEIYTIKITNSGIFLNDSFMQVSNVSNGVYSSSTMFLFEINQNGIPVNFQANPIDLQKRIYSAKIYNNDTLVRDFIPVLDGNGVPCMYDRVEKKYYYNAGTGDFVAGPVIGE